MIFHTEVDVTHSPLDNISINSKVKFTLSPFDDVPNKVDTTYVTLSQFDNECFKES